MLITECMNDYVGHSVLQLALLFLDAQNATLKLLSQIAILCTIWNHYLKTTCQKDIFLLGGREIGQLYRINIGLYMSCLFCHVPFDANCP